MNGNFKKEKTAVLIQLGIFWLIPLIMLKSGPIFMVMLMLWASFVLSLWLCLVSKSRVKYLMPFAAAVLFLPTVPVFYNSSALMHALWYFVVSGIALVIGTIANKIRDIIKKRQQDNP